ncbi:TPA: hypothetical protein ACH3X1_004534 [Trebouxia sp. C0004]
MLFFSASVLSSVCVLYLLTISEASAGEADSLVTARVLASSNSSSTAQCESEGLSGECNDDVVPRCSVLAVTASAAATKAEALLRLHPAASLASAALVAHKSG